MTVQLMKWYLPLDETGVAASNAIVNEEHVLTDDVLRLVFPKFGNYYKKSLTVQAKQPDGSWSNVAIGGYNCAEINLRATLDSGYEVCKYIVLSIPSTVEVVRISYQGLGGIGQFNASALMENVNKVLDDIHTVHWNNIKGKPRQFPPSHHLEDARNVYGLEYVTAALERIRFAVQMKELSHMYLRDELFNYLHRSFKEFTNIYDAGVAKDVSETNGVLTPNLNTIAQTQVGALSVLNKAVFYTSWAKQVFEQWAFMMKGALPDFDYYWSALHNEPLMSKAIVKMRDAGPSNTYAGTYAQWKAAAGDVIANVGGCVWRSNVAGYNATTKALPALVGSDAISTIDATVVASSVVYSNNDPTLNLTGSAAGGLGLVLSTPVALTGEWTVVYVGSCTSGTLVDLGGNYSLATNVPNGVKIGIYNKATGVLAPLVLCNPNEDNVFRGAISSSSLHGFTNVFVDMQGNNAYTVLGIPVVKDVSVSSLSTIGAHPTAGVQTLTHASIFNKALSQIEIHGIMEYILRTENHWAKPAVPTLVKPFKFN